MHLFQHSFFKQLPILQYFLLEVTHITLGVVLLLLLGFLLLSSVLV